MLNFPGTSQVSINAVQTLGSAAGRNYPLSPDARNQVNVMLTAVHVLLTTTATVGNRVLALQAKDAAGNILCHVPIGTNVAASLATRITWAADAPNFTSGNFIVANLPAGFVLPALSTIQILDQANIDVADTITVNITATV